jgi:hypothetical protein
LPNGESPLASEFSSFSKGGGKNHPPLHKGGITMKEQMIVLDEVWIDERDDQIILLKKIRLLLSQIKEKRERVVVLICDEPRQILEVKK